MGFEVEHGHFYEPAVAQPLARRCTTPMPEPRSRIRLCGPLAVEIDGRDATAELPAGQPESLLCFLLANAGRPVDRGELIGVVWPERPPRDPQAALRPILSRLRRALAPATIDGRDRLRLALPEPVWLDVEQAANELEEARRLGGAGSWTAAREHARAAAELLAPGFLPHHDEEWVRARRRQLEELALEAIEWLGRSALAGEELGAAKRAARELVARSRYRESGHRLLMESLAAGGNVAEALRVYDDLRVRLREELGTAPAPALQALHGRLLAGEPAPAPPPQPPRPSRRPAPPPAGSAMVGREPQLERLREAWRGAMAGERRLVFVAGEPGIGKTRLVTELAREAHDAGLVLRAASHPDALVPYQPLVEALRLLVSALGIAQPPPGPGGHELARLVPELGENAPPAAAADPETRRYVLFEAVADLLDAASARAPVLLVLDDLHWADRGTLHLLRHVVRSGREPALLVTGTYRSTEVAAGHPLAELLADLRRERLFERILLDGLDAPQVAQLIAAEAGREAASAVVAAVHGKTDGNPFFVQEVVRDLLESGALVESGGVWGAALRSDEIGVPEGVAEVLVSRLARLSDRCRDVLSSAAVLGREFDFRTLAAMHDGGEDAVLAALEEALAAHLVVEVGEHGDAGFAFRHALVRETLYNGLSTPRRHRVHARAARSIEAIHGEDSLAALATHERLAGPAGDNGRAIAFSLRAGEQARELSAWEDAAAHWDGALAVMERGGGAAVPDQARLLVALGELMVVAGDPGRHIGYLERALALYEELGDEQRAAQVHSRLGTAWCLVDSIYGEHLDVGRAFRHLDAARPALTRGPVRKALGHLENGVGIALMYRHDIPAGLEAAGRAMEIGQRLGDSGLWASAAMTYGWHVVQAGRLKEGFDVVERAFTVADREQRPFMAWMGANTRAQLAWGLGAPDEAQAFFERPLRLPYIGETAFRHETADGIGRCHLTRGEIDAARRLLGDARPAWISHSLKPLIDLWDGRYDDVARLAERTLETSRRTGNRWDEWAAHHLAARVHLARGEHDRATQRLETALTIVLAGGARYFELWVRTDLIRALVGSGRLSEAREHVGHCRAIVDNGEDWRARVAHVGLAEAAVLTASGDADAATPLFARAERIFARYRLVREEAEAARRGVIDATQR
jgi:DNA-binding SARP family transcriptional activator/tetratricopeptide (TPR) repeat protein